MPVFPNRLLSTSLSAHQLARHPLPDIFCCPSFEGFLCRKWHAILTRSRVPDFEELRKCHAWQAFSIPSGTVGARAYLNHNRRLVGANSNYLALCDATSLGLASIDQSAIAIAISEHFIQLAQSVSCLLAAATRRLAGQVNRKKSSPAKHDLTIAISKTTSTRNSHSVFLLTHAAAGPRSTQQRTLPQQLLRRSTNSAQNRRFKLSFKLG